MSLQMHALKRARRRARAVEPQVRAEAAEYVFREPISLPGILGPRPSMFGSTAWAREESRPLVFDQIRADLARGEKATFHFTRSPR